MPLSITNLGPTLDIELINIAALKVLIECNGVNLLHFFFSQKKKKRKKTNCTSLLLHSYHINASNIPI